VLIKLKDGTEGFWHYNNSCEIVAWMPTSDLPAFHRIPDPPDGWRFRKEGEAFDKRAQHWNCGRKQWVTTGNLHGYSRDDIYIVPVDPPEPQYRPFANAAEFEPYKSRWWRYKSMGDDEQVPPSLFNDKIHGTQYWSDAFTNKVFADGTPFGVRIDQ
jgi:hypothetical protein